MQAMDVNLNRRIIQSWLMLRNLCFFLSGSSCSSSWSSPSSSRPLTRMPFAPSATIPPTKIPDPSPSWTLGSFSLLGWGSTGSRLGATIRVMALDKAYMVTKLTYFMLFTWSISLVHLCCLTWEDHQGSRQSDGQQETLLIGETSRTQMTSNTGTAPRTHRTNW